MRIPVSHPAGSSEITPLAERPSGDAAFERTAVLDYNQLFVFSGIE
jgi:hypothetical protein